MPGPKLVPLGVFVRRERCFEDGPCLAAVLRHLDVSKVPLSLHRIPDVEGERGGVRAGEIESARQRGIYAVAVVAPPTGVAAMRRDRGKAPLPGSPLKVIISSSDGKFTM